MSTTLFVRRIVAYRLIAACQQCCSEAPRPACRRNLRLSCMQEVLCCSQERPELSATGVPHLCSRMISSPALRMCGCLETSLVVQLILIH